MKIFFLFFLMFVSGILFAQDVISLENGEDYRPEKVNTFLRNLYVENDHVISFRTKFTDKNDDKSDYFILALKSGNLSAYNYLNRTDKLQPIKLPRESLELVWKTFIQNDLFKIRNEKDISNFCPVKYEIYNSYTYEFVILSNGKMKKLSYYNPEYYDNACYGMAERQKIVNSVSVITYLLNN